MPPTPPATPPCRPDVLDVSLFDTVSLDELRLVVEVMALANRCAGPRVPTAQLDLILSTVKLDVTIPADRISEQTEMPQDWNWVFRP